MSQEFATLSIGDKSYKLPIIEGTRGDKAIDIRSLLKETGYITLDSGYMNTGACTSAITYLDGTEGFLIIAVMQLRILPKTAVLPKLPI